MRKVFVITWNDIRLFLQEPTNWIQLLIIPLGFVYVMGLAFGGGGGGLPTLRLDVLDEDGSAASEALIAALAEANPKVVVCPADNDNEDPCRLEGSPLTAEVAYDRLTRGISFATLTIPTGYADALAGGEPVELVFQSNADLNAPRVVLQTVQSVITRIGGAAAAAELSTEAAESLGVINTDSRDAFYAERYAEAEAAWGPPPPIELVVESTQQTDTATTGNTQTPGTGFGQSAPGIATMFVMMNVLGLASLLIEERLDGILPRLIVMPIRRAQLLGGKILRGFTLGLFQLLLILAFGSLLGVDFGGDLLAVLVLSISYVLAVTAMAIALATLVRTPDQASGIGLLASMTLAPLGGAWWPLEIVPDFMKTIGHISPIAWCMDGFNALIFFNGGLSDVIVPSLVLLGFAAVFFAFGIARFRYE